jgi:hypothetical protein
VEFKVSVGRHTISTRRDRRGLDMMAKAILKVSVTNLENVSGCTEICAQIPVVFDNI